MRNVFLFCIVIFCSCSDHKKDKPIFILDGINGNCLSVMLNVHSREFTYYGIYKFESFCEKEKIDLTKINSIKFYRFRSKGYKSLSFEKDREELIENEYFTIINNFGDLDYSCLRDISLKCDGELFLF